MKPLRDRDLERLLTVGDVPQPPADLADRIKAEIPDVLPAPIRQPDAAARSTTWRRFLPLAALLVVAIGGSLLTLNLRRDVDPLASRWASEDATVQVQTAEVPSTEVPSAETLETQTTHEPAAVSVIEAAASSLGDSPASEPLATAPDGVDTPPKRQPIARSESPATPESQTTPTRREVLAAEPRIDPIATPSDDARPDLAGRRRAVDASKGENSPDGKDAGAEYAKPILGHLRTNTEIAPEPRQTEARIEIERLPPALILEESDLVFGIPDAQAPPTGAATESSSSTIRGRSPRAEKTRPPSASPPPPLPPPSTPPRVVATGLGPSGATLRPVAEAAVEEVRAQSMTRRPETPKVPPTSYDNITFRDYGSNPWVDPRADRLSTFGLDVDTGSFNIVKRFIEDGRLPDPAAVRVEELINAFDYGDRPPRRGDFAVHAEIAPSPFGESSSSHLLRFGIAAREVGTAARPSVDLILVVDTSGSMAREDRLGLVQDAVSMLLGQLRSDDRVGLVTFGSTAQIALLPTSDHEAVRRCLHALAAAGSTNAAHGLHLGYQLAADYRRRGTTSRVMLLSDGVANVGTVSAAGMLEEVAENRAAGVELTTVGVGMGNYNDELLEQLADRGDGRYAYVDDREEAHRLFVETLTGTLTTVAAETKVQVDFDPELVERYRLIGYENRAVADRDFRNDRVDAGEIGSGHTAVALYEVELYRDVHRIRRNQPIATLRLRHRSTRDDEMVENAYKVTTSTIARSFERATPAFRLTALVAEAGEILRRSPHARNGSLERVFRDTQRVSGDFIGDRRVADWVALIGRAARLE